MLTCPRCGNAAEYLADEVFSLLRCEFCDDLIDATDEALADAAASRPMTAPAAGSAWRSARPIPNRRSSTRRST